VTHTDKDKPEESNDVTESRNIEDDSVRFFLAWFVSRFMLAPVFWFYTRVLNSTEIIGRENMEHVKGKSFLLCPNHTCSFDIWAGWEIGFLGLNSFFSMDTYLCGLGAVERLGGYLVRTFCLTAGVLPVDRTKGTEQYALQDLLRLFSEKKKLIGAMIYPEGTRSKTGRLSRNFKSGVGWVQGQTGVPVIPMYHIGYNVAFPTFGKKFKIVIGEPVDLSEFEGKGENPLSWVKISEKVMSEIRILEEKYNPATGEDIDDDGKIEVLPHTWLPHLKIADRPLGFVIESDEAEDSLKLGLVPPSWQKSGSKGFNLEKLHSFFPKQSASCLGSSQFKEAHQLKFAYGVTPFEREVCTVDMVSKLLCDGYLAFAPTDFLTIDEISEKICQLRQGADSKAIGLGYRFHAYNNDYEQKRMALAIEEDISRIYISGYLRASKSMIHYRVKGMKKRPDGAIEVPHSIFARVTDSAIALYFASPPPADILDELLSEGLITSEEADLGSKMPISQDLIVEPELNKGGLKQDLFSLYPSVKAELRAKMVSRNAPVRVGVSGEIATPEAVAAAFRMGADFVLTGLVNSLTVEAGGSLKRRNLLFKTTSTDVTYAPSYEFLDSELPVTVTRFGTMFATKAKRMEDILRTTVSFSGLSESDRQFMEKNVFQKSLAEAYESSIEFCKKWWPDQVKSSSSDKVKAAMLMKHWLFTTTQMAFDGIDNRELDYQVRADGGIVAFNKWRIGSVFDDEDKLSVIQLSKNLMEGALVISRMRSLREMGVDILPEAIYWKAITLPSN
jgi:PfaD family protein